MPVQARSRVGAGPPPTCPASRCLRLRAGRICPCCPGAAEAAGAPDPPGALGWEGVDWVGPGLAVMAGEEASSALAASHTTAREEGRCLLLQGSTRMKAACPDAVLLVAARLDHAALAASEARHAAAARPRGRWLASGWARLKEMTAAAAAAVLPAGKAPPAVVPCRATVGFQCLPDRLPDVEAPSPAQLAVHSAVRQAARYRREGATADRVSLPGAVASQKASAGCLAGPSAAEALPKAAAAEEAASMPRHVVVGHLALLIPATVSLSRVALPVVHREEAHWAAF